jgi:hypothetical protein
MEDFAKLKKESKLKKTKPTPEPIPEPTWATSN